MLDSRTHTRLQFWTLGWHNSTDPNVLWTRFRTVFGFRATFGLHTISVFVRLSMFTRFSVFISAFRFSFCGLNISNAHASWHVRSWKLWKITPETQNANRKSLKTRTENDPETKAVWAKSGTWSLAPDFRVSIPRSRRPEAFEGPSVARATIATMSF